MFAGKKVEDEDEYEYDLGNPADGGTGSIGA